MTVISPYQRQLVFTGSGIPRTRKNKLNFFKKAAYLLSFKGSFALALSLTVFCGLSLFFFAVDSVLLSFRIQSLSKEIEDKKTAKEKLELKQTALLSPDSLKDYALMVKLENPSSISYQA